MIDDDGLMWYGIWICRRGTHVSWHGNGLRFRGEAGGFPKVKGKVRHKFPWVSVGPFVIVRLCKNND